MKKVISLFLMAVFCVSLLAGCGNGGSAQNAGDGDSSSSASQESDSPAENSADCEHVIVTVPAVEPTCTTDGSTESSYCSLCGEVFTAAETIPALGHTTTTGTCENCGLSFGQWTTGYYVDEFDSPTDDGYVINLSHWSGTFSNSATTDSLLYVDFLADTSELAIFLYEYGRTAVKNSSSRYVDEYDITMKAPDGTKHELTGTLYCGGDRLFIDQKYKQLVLDAMAQEGSVSFYIVQRDRTTTTYLFTMNTSNFTEEYNKLMELG